MTDQPGPYDEVLETLDEYIGQLEVINETLRNLIKELGIDE